MAKLAPVGDASTRRAGICKLRPAAGATAAASARRTLMLESGLRRGWRRVAVGVRCAGSVGAGRARVEGRRPG